MSDPDGSGPQSIEEGAARVITLLLALVGFDVGEGVPAGALTDGGAIAMCRPVRECRVVASTGLAGVVIPAGALSEPTLVFVAPMPATADPFEPHGFDDYPHFFDFGSIPQVALGGTTAAVGLSAGGSEIVAGVCAVAPPDPLAPPAEVVPHLRFAQLAQSTAGTAVEIAPLRVPYFLDCPLPVGGAVHFFGVSGAVDETSLDAGSPPVVTSVDFPAYLLETAGSSASGTVGFSDPDGDVARAIFVEVSDPNGAFPGGFDLDPGVTGLISGSFAFQLGCPADSPCPEGPVTLSVQLEDLEGNLSEAVAFSFEVVGPTTTTTLTFDDSTLLDGQIGTATATVDPAPEESENPIARFVVDAGTVNQRTIERPLVDGRASVTIFCDFVGGQISDTDLEIGRGTHTIRAFFLGTPTFDPSSSATRFVTCQAGS